MIELDTEFETPKYSPQCCRCRHFRGWRDGEEMGWCSAFDQGIPIRIWTAQRDHRKPYPGDNGIRFEPLPGDRHPMEDGT